MYGQNQAIARTHRSVGGRPETAGTCTSHPITLLAQCLVRDLAVA